MGEEEAMSEDEGVVEEHAPHFLAAE